MPTVTEILHPDHQHNEIVRMAKEALDYEARSGKSQIETNRESLSILDRRRAQYSAMIAEGVDGQTERALSEAIDRLDGIINALGEMV